MHTHLILGISPQQGYANEFVAEAQGRLDEATKDAFKYLAAWTENMGGVTNIRRKDIDLRVVANHALKHGARKQHVADALYLMILE
jgi:hypothetical protein